MARKPRQQVGVVSRQVIAAAGRVRDDECRARRPDVELAFRRGQQRASGPARAAFTVARAKRNLPLLRGEIVALRRMPSLR
jgi:hypothetical protein